MLGSLLSSALGPPPQIPRGPANAGTPRGFAVATRARTRSPPLVLFTLYSIRAPQLLLQIARVVLSCHRYINQINHTINEEMFKIGRTMVPTDNSPEEGSLLERHKILHYKTPLGPYLGGMRLEVGMCIVGFRPESIVEFERILIGELVGVALQISNGQRSQEVVATRNRRLIVDAFYRAMVHINRLELVRVTDLASDARSAANQAAVEYEVTALGRSRRAAYLLKEMEAKAVAALEAELLRDASSCRRRNSRLSAG